jgi:hypothetical protein
VSDLARHRFRFTHPFHPLLGREFDIVLRRHSWGFEWVYFHDDDGRLRSVRTSWTDLAEVDPFVVMAAGRSPFRTDDLLRLAELLEDCREMVARSRRV